MWLKKVAGLVLVMISLIISVAVLAEPADYRLGPGDVLGIDVWGYKEMQYPEVIVRPDGKISFPLVGEVTAAGMNAAELTGKLTTALSAYVKEPKVTINVVKLRTVRVYVLGEVTKPGLCEIDKSHNLLDAIGAAGGFTKSADAKRVYLVRNGQTDSYTEVNLDRLLKKGDLSQNYALNNGDVVYFTRNKVDFARDILPFIAAAYQIKHFDD
ncbi:MAG TPA: polysaccharide biosynthesis/export family protein [Bacillota bacterium]|nr:polysaccharide biosynthesis/export family protein [Bacillota bacterium]